MAEEGSSPTERVVEARRAVDRYWEDLLEVEPLLGTQVGDERYDDRLPDPSPEGLARRESISRAALETAASFDRSQLDMVTRTTLDLMDAIARRDLDLIRFRFDRFGAVTHLWGPGQLLAEIASYQQADTPERFERYVRRLGAVPDHLDQVCRIVDEAARVGQTVPGVVADRALGQIQRLVASPDAVVDVLMQPVRDGLPAARETLAELVRGSIVPAYGRYLEALERYRPAATETIGLYALNGGEEMYASQIEAWTSLSMKPREIHQTGVEQLEAIQLERVRIAQSLGFPTPDAAIASLNASGRNVASSREEMVRLAEQQVQRGWDAAPRFFGRMPSANCHVRAVEEFREQDMPFAFYQNPSADGSRPGVYYVNASDLSERPLHHLATTTYHEANPGHHLQVTIEQEIQDRPALRRFGGLLAGSAFAEGWGLYSERLADEMELFVDQYERMGMLDAQGMRAARLIVDTGIHAFGWDRDRAIRQMEEAGVPHLDAVIEVDRYIALPGQALAYMIGQLEIQRWRSEAAEREGTRFSLRGFHDRLLALGSLPLSALDREFAAGADGNGSTQT